MYLLDLKAMTSIPPCTACGIENFPTVRVGWGEATQYLCGTCYHAASVVECAECLEEYDQDIAQTCPRCAQGTIKYVTKSPNGE